MPAWRGTRLALRGEIGQDSPALGIEPGPRLGEHLVTVDQLGAAVVYFPYAAIDFGRPRGLPRFPVHVVFVVRLEGAQQLHGELPALGIGETERLFEQRFARGHRPRVYLFRVAIAPGLPCSRRRSRSSSDRIREPGSKVPSRDHPLVRRGSASHRSSARSSSASCLARSWSPARTASARAVARLATAAVREDPRASPSDPGSSSVAGGSWRIVEDAEALSSPFGVTSFLQRFAAFALL